jgi:hypothetical protein
MPFTFHDEMRSMLLLGLSTFFDGFKGSLLATLEIFEGDDEASDVF